MAAASMFQGHSSSHRARIEGGARLLSDFQLACCLCMPAKSERIRSSCARWSELRLRGTSQAPLLRRDVVGADHLGPELELVLEQHARGFRPLPVRRKHIHPALLEGLAYPGAADRAPQPPFHPPDHPPPPPRPPPT